MDQIEFIFQMSDFDMEALLPQVSAALEKRLMLLRQKITPKFLKLGNGAKTKKLEERCDNAAREFLEGHKEGVEGKEMQVCFSEEEMFTVIGAVEDLDQDAATYDEIEFIMESADIFFVVYQGRGMVLQKKDLTMGTVDEFRAFATENIRPVISLTEEE